MADRIFDHHTHLDEGESGGSPWIFAIPFAVALIALVSLFAVWFTM
jgi:hypothetical protein